MKQYRFCLVQGILFTLRFVKCDGQCFPYTGTGDWELCTAQTAFRQGERKKASATSQSLYFTGCLGNPAPVR